MDIKLFNSNVLNVLGNGFIGGGGAYPVLDDLVVHCSAFYQEFVTSDVVTMNEAGKVSAWLPLDGTTITLAQAIGSKQPFFKPNAINGHPAIEFGKSAAITFFDFLLNLGDEFSVFIIMTESSRAESYVLTGAGGAGTPAILSKFPGFGNFEFFNQTEREIFNNTSTGPHVLSITRKNNVSLKMWFDNVKVVDQVADSNKPTAVFDMLGTVDGFASGFEGLAGEISIHSSVRPESQVFTIGKYFIDKWLDVNPNLLTEDGQFILTESGENITIE